MAVLSVQQSKIGGTNLAFAAAAAGGDTFAASDRTHLHVRNASAGAVTVTVVVPGNTKFGQAAPDVPVTVPVGDSVIGPFPSDLADSGTNLVGVLYSAVASVTVALVGV